MSYAKLFPIRYQITPGLSFLGTLFQAILYSLHERTKRRVALATMFGYLLDCQRFDQAIVTRLNDSLKLSRGPESLNFPIMFHSWIWSSTDTYVTLPRGRVDIRSIKTLGLTPGEIYLSARQLSERLPTCVRYGSPNKMINDIAEVLKGIAQNDDIACLVA